VRDLVSEKSDAATITSTDKDEILHIKPFGMAGFKTGAT
jgi:hypothetical protein